jgi:ligand-binding sensor domain-containing protein
LDIPEAHFVAAQGPLVMVAGLKRMALSLDDGASWDNVPMPAELTQIYAVAVDDAKNIWVGGTEGVFYSTDFGLTWNTLRNLYVTAVDAIYFDAANERVLVTSSNQTVAFAVHLPDYKVSFWDAGWTLRFVRPVGDHLIGATLFDGMVVEPKMVDSVMK